MRAGMIADALIGVPCGSPQNAARRQMPACWWCIDAAGTYCLFESSAAVWVTS
jgi:hypothetical protein